MEIFFASNDISMLAAGSIGEPRHVEINLTVTKTGFSAFHRVYERGL